MFTLWVLVWTGLPPSMTPPVRTVVFPPSYGVTSVLVVSTKTRACRARSRRDCLGELVEETVVSDGEEEEYEKPELELDERELLREWEDEADMEESVENGDEERIVEGIVSLSKLGATH